MTIRELDQSEWNRLDGHPGLNGLGAPDPRAARVIIAEDDSGRLIAFWMMVATAHLEPVWIDPTYRGSMLAARMWRVMKGLLSALDLKYAFSFADRDEIRGYLSRLGFKTLPYSSHVYEMPGVEAFPVERH